MPLITPTVKYFITLKDEVLMTHLHGRCHAWKYLCFHYSTIVTVDRLMGKKSSVLYFK